MTIHQTCQTFPNFRTKRLEPAANHTQFRRGIIAHTTVRIQTLEHRARKNHMLPDTLSHTKQSTARVLRHRALQSHCRIKRVRNLENVRTF